MCVFVAFGGIVECNVKASEKCLFMFIKFSVRKPARGYRNKGLDLVHGRFVMVEWKYVIKIYLYIFQALSLHWKESHLILIIHG